MLYTHDLYNENLEKQHRKAEEKASMKEDLKKFHQSHLRIVKETKTPFY